MEEEWINNCDKETLTKIIQATRKINNNYKRMKDSTILKKLINNGIDIGKIIKHFANPPEHMQLAAVKLNGHNIRFIKNPSEVVKQAAVKQNGFSLQWITNPSEVVKQAAVKQNYYVNRMILYYNHYTVENW